MRRGLSLACAVVAGALSLGGCTPGAVRDGPPLAALQARADAAYRRGDWGSAARDYETLTARAPGVVDAWIRLGNARARLGQPQAAMAAYREALIRDPASARAWHNLGMVELRQARLAFAQLASVTPPDSPLHRRATELLEALGALTAADADAASPAPDAGQRADDG